MRFLDANAISIWHFKQEYRFIYVMGLIYVHIFYILFRELACHILKMIFKDYYIYPLTYCIRIQCFLYVEDSYMVLLNKGH